MENKKRIIFLILFLIVAAMTATAKFSKEENNEKIKIGVSDDISGFVIDYMINDKANNAEKYLEAYFIKDCCSKTSQWALTYDVLNMAIICKDAAKSFLENVEGFEIYGNCVMNSDIFVLRKETPETIGVTQNRNYQIDIVKKRFGDSVSVLPVISQGLPYSIENGQTDGALLDVTKAIHIDGIKYPSKSDEDIVTYVLIVNSDYKKTKQFKKFINDYNIAVKKLNSDEDILISHFNNYTNGELEKGGFEKWKIRLLSIEEN